MVQDDTVMQPTESLEKQKSYTYSELWTYIIIKQ
jgi:hypothetical protein